MYKRPGLCEVTRLLTYEFECDKCRKAHETREPETSVKSGETELYGNIMSSTKQAPTQESLNKNVKKNKLHSTSNFISTRTLLKKTYTTCKQASAGYTLFSLNEFQNRTVNKMNFIFIEQIIIFRPSWFIFTAFVKSKTLYTDNFARYMSKNPSSFCYNKLYAVVCELYNKDWRPESE